jgi:hypothetical protein
VEAGPLAVLAVAPGRGVGPGEPQPALGGAPGAAAAEGQGGEQFALAAPGAQEGGRSLGVVAQGGAAQPGGAGAAALGDQGAGQQRQQPPGAPAVQRAGQARDPAGQVGG